MDAPGVKTRYLKPLSDRAYQRKREEERAKQRAERRRLLNHGLVDLSVTKDMLIYAILDKKIKDCGFSRTTETYCDYNGIDVIGRLIQTMGRNMEANEEAHINQDLQPLGLALNMRIQGWEYPLTDEQRANLDKPTSILQISNRARKALNADAKYLGFSESKGMETLRDIARLKKYDLLKVPNFGRKSMKELEDQLAKFDLHFDMLVDGKGSDITLDLMNKLEENGL